MHARHTQQARELWCQASPVHPGTPARERLDGRRRLLAVGCAAVLATALLGRVRSMPPETQSEEHQFLSLALGALGPKLVAAGVIDTSRFIAACAQAGEPLNSERMQILTRGDTARVAFDSSSAHFLLNLFWAVGLANANPVLTHGAMVRNGMPRIALYASTGGWNLAAKRVMELYARLPLISLSKLQQERLEEVASGVFRPCCDNPTSFPDCNHGMAMLGLLTLLAAEGRDVDALFVAASTANRFWFPQQSAQLAIYLRRAQASPRVDARVAVGRQFFSGSGFRKVAAWARGQGLAAPAGAAC